MDPTIIAAFIGLLGVILAALIPHWLQERKKKQTAIPQSNSAGKIQDVSKVAEVQSLLAQLSQSVTKADALRIENEIFHAIRSDIALFSLTKEQYVAPAREAMVVVAGRLIFEGNTEPVLKRFLIEKTKDPDKWVRKKANDALVLNNLQL